MTHLTTPRSAPARQQLEKVNFDTLRISDSYVTASSEAKDLGFWLDSQMKCDTNVNKSCKAAFFHLFMQHQADKKVPDT